MASLSPTTATRGSCLPHATRATAEKEAYSLNAQYAARRAAAIAQAHAARHRQHAFAERRPVRWFEPDAFA